MESGLFFVPWKQAEKVQLIAKRLRGFDYLPLMSNNVQLSLFVVLFTKHCFFFFKTPNYEYSKLRTMSKVPFK